MKNSRRKKNLFYGLGVCLCVFLVWGTFLLVEIGANQFVPDYGFNRMPDSPSGAESTMQLILKKHRLLFNIVSAIFKGDGRRYDVRTTPAEKFNPFIAHAFSGKKELHYGNDPNQPLEASFTVTLDQWKRRSTVQSETATKHMLFFGGSFVFGDIVNDDQTLASVVTKLAPEFQGYNYGYPGGAPTVMLTQLLARDMPKEIREKSGYSVLVWNNFHADRIFPVPRSISYVKDMPHYSFSADGRLQYGKMVGEAVPLTSAWMQFLWDIRLLHVLDRDISDWLMKDDAELACSIFKEINFQLRRKLPLSKFVVLWYPGSLPDSDILSLDKCLETNEIAQILMPEIEAREEDHFTDGHPRPELHRATAELLLKKLSLLESERANASL